MTPHRPRPTQQGFSLIEALIAMVVLSLGLLGLASLQINALRFNQVAHLRSQAATFAYQMLDAMRASPTDAMKLSSGAFPTGALETARKEWADDVAAQIPQGSGKICLNASPDPDPDCKGGVGSFAVITVEWTEAGADESKVSERSDQQFVLVSQVAP